jgi:hypothetical protein
VSVGISEFLFDIFVFGLRSADKQAHFRILVKEPFAAVERNAVLKKDESAFDYTEHLKRVAHGGAGLTRLLRAYIVLAREVEYPMHYTAVLHRPADASNLFERGGLVAYRVAAINFGMLAAKVGKKAKAVVTRLVFILADEPYLLLPYFQIDFIKQRRQKRQKHQKRLPKIRRLKIIQLVQYFSHEPFPFRR